MCALGIRDIEDLAGIHQPVRVERALDATHHVQGVGSQFFDQRPFFAKTDAVFALLLLVWWSIALRCASSTYCAGSIHLQRPIHHITHAFLDCSSFLWVAIVVEDTFVEVAIADMAQDTSE